MPPPHRRTRHARALQRERARAARRVRRIVGGTILGTALIITLLVTAFGSGNAGPLRTKLNSSRLLPAGPPKFQPIARLGTSENLQTLVLPISEARVTAIAYHASGDGALALDPIGRQANEGVVTRLAHRLFGGPGGGLPYYMLSGGEGPSTSALDVGAPPGTDVYSPVNGTVIGLSPYVLNGKREGARIELQPSGVPSIVVALTQLQPDPALAVGSTVTQGTSKVGTVIRLDQVEKQSLARYTQDAGNHVTLQAFPAATLSLH